jgi:hypothetical protein
MLPDEEPSAEQIAILRRMTGEQRLKVAGQLYWSARKLKTAGVRSQHPDWSDEQIKAEVNRIFLNAGD